MCRGRSTFPEVSSNSKSGSTFGFPANNNGARLDMHYYVDTHMPLSIRFLSTHTGFKDVSLERQIGGAIPGADATFVDMCHFLFDSTMDFMARSLRTQPRSKGTCRTPLILPRRFRSTKFSFLARTASGERTLSRRVTGIWPIWCLRPVRVCSSTIT
jgi:hypothetical protein